MIVIKRIFAIVIALVLSLSLMVVPSFAADEDYTLVPVLTNFTVESGDILPLPSLGLIPGDEYVFQALGQELTIVAEIHDDEDDNRLNGIWLYSDLCCFIDLFEPFEYPLNSGSYVDGLYIIYVDLPSPVEINLYHKVYKGFESSEVLTGVTDMVGASTGWVSSFLDGITQSPLLLLFVLTAFVSLGISIISLVKKK